MEVKSADVVRLIEAHLLENGLQESARTLQHESGIKMSGQLVKNYAFHASAGNWGAVLESLSYVDPDMVVVVAAAAGDDNDEDGDDKNKKPTTQSFLLRELIAEVHEMTILELAEAGDLALAYATYRIVQKELERSDAAIIDAKDAKKHSKKKKSKEHSESEPPSSSVGKMSRARLLEQKLAALAAWAANHQRTGSSASGGTAPVPLPKDYYGPSDRSKQERREEIGRRLDEAIPLVPKQRLTSLLQQAVAWQAHTGQLPMIKRLWHGDDHEGEGAGEDADDPNRKKKKKRRSTHRREFDLVLGTAMVDSVPVGASLNRSNVPVEPIPAAPWSTVKLGKRTRPESAAFLPDGKGLVTGSSDGLIEVWDASSQYAALMDSLEYQRKEELMGHDGSDAGITALAVSNDGHVLVSADATGHVKVWNFASGRCLRSFQAHNRAVTCLGLAPDASHLLTGSRDGTCREFGLRTARMLKEFGAPGSAASSSVSHCSYHVLGNDHADDDPDARRLLIMTASSDGAVRIWDRSSQDLIRTLRPISVVGSKSSQALVGSSMVVADAVASAGNDQAVGSPPIQAVLALHTPPGTIIVVPRGPRAFLVDLAGTVLRVFDAGQSSGNAFVAATVSCTNQWLYGVTEDGALHVFSVETGKLETSFPSFGDETMRLSKDSGGAAESGGLAAEITGILHHPNRSILAAFSNSKSQKGGQVVLWK